MKRLLMIGLAFILTACMGGPGYVVVPPEEQGHKQVIELAGLDKKTLYTRASEWFALTFVSGKEVIQNKDSVKGRIIGRAVTTIYMPGGIVDTPLQYNHSVVIDVKEGKARIQLADYSYIHGGNTPTYAMHVNPLNENMKSLAEDFANYLKTGGSASVAGGSDDW